MPDVTTFLTRWLYVCNMVRDVADIQSFPYTPLHTHPSLGHQQHHHHNNVPLHSPPHYEQEWNDYCLRGVLSYPPGTQRLYAMDAIRLELVQKLSARLRMTDDVLHRFSMACKHRQHSTTTEDEEEDPYLDADVEILKAFEQATTNTNEQQERDIIHDEATLVITKNGTDLVKSATTTEEQCEIPLLQQDVPDPNDVEMAYRASRDLTDYLPQLVAAVLKSPPAFQPQLMDPIRKLRRLLLTRCLQDANWGIELCWLLEADVGRAWKTLFEHRQQTGRRLIIVLPAEKAAVLAKIGTEKREAFDLLQDAEQATAYGYTFQNVHDITHDATAQSFDYDLEPTPPKLPSSLSLRRCSHFGDTMHFIDKLTQISLDLRSVPTIQRHDYLQECLLEMNRRLRRRMITRGDVSLDVEDNQGPHDWPHLSDMAADVIKYSVHFPLIPKRGTWPANDQSDNTMEDKTDAGTVRVMNIVAPECRILASRERCPYLVHLEVADTGLEGSDARLYASGAYGMGATVEESLGMNPRASSAATAATQHSYASGEHSYRIPSELLDNPSRESILRDSQTAVKDDNDDDNGASVPDMMTTSSDAHFPRAGYQSDEGMFHPPESGDYLFSNPYDMVRQQEYEQLHQEMKPYPAYQLPPPTIERKMLTTKSALLERVYGLPWAMKVEQIRQTSPYGNVKGWRLASFIMKAGEDIRREALVMQVITKMNEWFQTDIPEKHRPTMRPYTIMCVGGDAGMLECLSDARSIDEVKKKTDGFLSLRDYFERAYGPPSSPSNIPHHVHRHGSQSPVEHTKEDIGDISFEQAQDNFLRSLVGYSLVCYVLQIKDRHNANILLDRAGHIMHIDFGFVLGDTPKMAKVPLFNEKFPFKLSAEFWEVLGGWNFHDGGLGVKFCKMFEIAYACAASHAEDIASVVEGAMLNLSRSANEARDIANDVRSRLRMRGPAGSVEQKTFIMDLVNTALASWRGVTYDWLQKSMNGYQ